MNIRRSAAALAAVAAVAVIGAPAQAAVTGSSPAPSASPALPPGLYGSSDPKYDGVWRQSLALLAQHTVGVRPAAQAVDWLAGQQCASGAFAPFRADLSRACDARTAVDSNSTAAAVQALAALGGHDAVTGKAVSWLKSVQNKDGGWGYTPGGPSDANSTSVVVGALAAVGDRPASVVKDGKSPYDALLKLALPCSGDGAGAFAYQPDQHGKLAANADATAAGVVAALGQGLAATPQGKTGGTPRGKAGSAARCTGSGAATPARAAANGAAYLAHAVAEDGHLTSALPGATAQPDYGNTADAVVALAAQGGAGQARKPLEWLEKNAGKWAAQSGPAAYAQLVFAAHATGTDPRAFGGLDLVEALNATGPAPQAPVTGSTSGDATEKGDSSSHTVWWIAGGACLVVVLGAVAWAAGRRKSGAGGDSAERQQP
ncbi:prenyltransferase/squalene oxidase repeat-containing protein [Streptomyces sp. NRRL S-340]|uniref:prenyltransferase/squalene oxidase repeat-containing protein n=1 Tax=Streptomyces sp. NRRL S-340 TaxID=1463901 RepID=UPI00055EE35C|nr:prenyltransferase/squalene oxidase repeat-containing protein [Streptomyces sp. NRRL S-340]